jgi:hypothetical protein
MGITPLDGWNVVQMEAGVSQECFPEVTPQDPWLPYNDDAHYCLVTPKVGMEINEALSLALFPTTTFCHHPQLLLNRLTQ